MSEENLDLDTKVKKVFKYLIEGQNIKLGDEYYNMSKDYQIARYVVDENMDLANKTILVNEDNLGVIVMLAQNITDDEFYALGVTSVLDELIGKKRKRD